MKLCKSLTVLITILVLLSDRWGVTGIDAVSVMSETHNVADVRSANDQPLLTWSLSETAFRQSAQRVLTQVASSGANPVIQAGSGILVSKSVSTGTGDHRVVFNGERITYTIVVSNSLSQTLVISDVTLADELPKDVWGQVQIDQIECADTGDPGSDCVLDYETREILTPLGRTVQVTVPIRVHWTLANREPLVLNPGEQIVRTFSGRVIGQNDGTVIVNDAYLIYTLNDSTRFEFSPQVRTTVLVRIEAGAQTSISEVPTWLSSDVGGTVALDWGDFDHDGDFDLAIAATTGTTVYRNEGGRLIRFWEQSNYTLGVRWADVNPGGNMELIAVGASISNSAVTSGTNYIYSLNNDGSASFQTFSSEYQLLRPVVGDVDNDGRVDLIASTNAIGPDCPVRLFTNTGSGFADISRCVSRSATASIVLGDYNNDGKLDLALGRFPNQLVLLTDVVQALSQPPENLALVSVDNSTTFLPYDLRWGDYDGDGYLDLAAAFPMDRVVRIYRNLSGTGFARDLEFRTTSFYTPLSIDWADFNLDGRLDLVVADTPPIVYLNTGDIWEFFSSSQVFRLPPDVINGQIWSIVAADQDNDGDLDLVLGNRDGASLIFTTFASLLSDGLVRVGDPTLPANSVAWGDADGDGALDLFYGAGGTSLRSGLYLNQGNGNFNNAAQWTHSYGPQATVAFANVNRDAAGKLDLTLGSASNIQIYYDGQLSVSPWQAGGSVNALAWGDVEGDGDLDLLVGLNGPNALYLNQGTALSTIPAWTSAQSDDTRSVAWADYDGDGYLDFAVGNYGGPVRVYRNVGAQSFSLAWSSSQSWNTTAVAWVDVNRDGRLDLSVGNYGQPNVIYANQGGMFGQTPVWVSGEVFKTTSLAWGDWDNDGDLDLAVGNDGEPDQVYVNRGVREGVPQLDWLWQSSESYRTTGVAWGDMDGDGDLDLAISQREGTGRNGVYINHLRSPSHLVANPTTVMPLPGNPSYVSVARPGTTKAAYFYSAPEVLSGPTNPTVTISYRVYDPDETRRGVNLGTDSRIYTTIYEYSTDGGGTWKQATPAATPPVSIPVNHTGTALTFDWNAIQDQVFNDNVLFRVTVVHFDPAGSAQYASSSAISPPFRVRATQNCVWPEHPTIKATPANPQPGQEVIFEGAVSQGSGVITFLWDLGDGTIKQGQSVKHTFKSSNRYNVVLSVSSEPCPLVRVVTATLQITVGSGLPDLYLPLVLKASQGVTTTSLIPVKRVAWPRGELPSPDDRAQAIPENETRMDVQLTPSDLSVQSNDAPATFIADVAGYSCDTYSLCQKLLLTDTVGIYSQPAINANGTRVAFWSTANLHQSSTRFDYYQVPTVLLVDDDDNQPDVRPYYENALSALGISYRVWDTNGTDNEPDLSTLAHYLAVIWFTGDTYRPTTGPGPAAEAALASYLNKTGLLPDASPRCLFISSQDYYWARNYTPLMQTYLGVGSADSDWSFTLVTGTGIYSGIYQLDFPGENWTDSILPDSTAQVAFMGGQSWYDPLFVSPIAISKTTADYRTTFWGFPFEALPGSYARLLAMYQTAVFCNVANVIPPTIVINEVSMGNPDGEWIELYNHGRWAINMAGWKLTITHSGTPFIYSFPPTFTLSSGQYVLVHELEGVNTPSDLYMGAGNAVDWMPGSGGAVGLIDGYGRGIDFVRWDASTAQPPLGAFWSGSNPATNILGQGGYETSTLGRSGDSNTGQDWCVRLRTPGSKNHPCNPDRNNLDGNIEVFVADIGVSGGGHVVTFTQVTSSTGSILGGFSLWPSLNADGSRLALFSDQDLSYHPVFYPTHRNADQNFEIFVFDQNAPDNPFLQLTDSMGGFSLYPSINADGSRVVLASDRDLHNNPLLPGRNNSAGHLEVFIAEINTTENVTITQLTQAAAQESYDLPVISGDGNYVALVHFKPDGNSEIQLWHVQDTANPTLDAVFSSGSVNTQPAIDYAGDHIAFVSNRTLSNSNADGSREIFMAIRNGHAFDFIQVTASSLDIVNEQPSIDGRGDRVAYVTNNGVWLYDRSERIRIHLDNVGGVDSRPSVSADGSYVAYASGQRLYRVEIPLVDLEISKISMPHPLVAGMPVTYVITVTNLGPGDALGAVVSDTLPPKFNFPASWQCIPSPGAQCTASGNGLALHDLITLPVGSHVIYLFSARLSASASADVLNMAEVIAPPEVMERNKTNNRAYDQQLVTTEADLQIAKVTSSTTIAGMPLTYTLYYTNTAPSDARDVVITDTLPTGSQWGGMVNVPSPFSAPTVNGQQVIWTTSQLAAQASGTLIFTVTVEPGASGNLVNRAEISNLASDPRLQNNVALVTTTVIAQADLDVTKLVQPDPAVAGCVLTYTLTYTNHGPSHARQVVLTDTLPISVTWGGVVSQGLPNLQRNSADGWVRWTTPTLPAGTSGQIVFTVTVTDNVSLPTLITNLVTITAQTTDPKPDSNSKSISTTVQVPTDLQIGKAARSGVVAPGEMLTYTILVTNSNLTVQVLNATASDGLSSGILSGLMWTCQPSPGSSCGLTGGSGPLVHNIERLLPGGWVTYTVWGTVVPSTTQTSLTNTAIVTLPIGYLDTNPANNQATALVTLSPRADLRLYKSVWSEPVWAGSTLTYTLVYTNLGPSFARAITLTDRLTTAVTFGGVLPGSPAPASVTPSPQGQIVVWNRPELADNGVFTVQFTVTVSSGLPPQTPITNTVDLVADTADPTMPNEAQVVVTTVNRVPVIAQGDGITVGMSEDGVPVPFALILDADDPDGHALTWSISVMAAHGVATAGGSGISKVIGYTPTPDYNGTDSFVVQVSDGFTGTDAITVNVVITPVNDAPVLDASYNPTLTAILSTSLPLTTTAATVADVIVDGSISDTDGVAIEAIAIIATDGCPYGVWQYSLDGGNTWLDVAPVADGNALLLAPTNRIRFNPNGSGTGICTFTFRAWDQSSGNAGDRVDLGMIGTGGTTPYSIAFDMASIVIQ